MEQLKKKLNLRNLVEWTNKTGEHRCTFSIEKENYTVKQNGKIYTVIIDEKPIEVDSIKKVIDLIVFHQKIV